MKCVKITGLVAMALALMAFIGAGTASATRCDRAAGTTCASGTVVAAENEGNITLSASASKITCEKSSLSGKVTNIGSGSETAVVTLEAFTLNLCSGTVAVLAPGSLELHTDPNDETGESGNGTLTSSGWEFTTEVSGLHCVYRTGGTDIGTITGSVTTKSTAAIDANAKIPRTGGRSGVFCGSESELTGSYLITAPDTFNVT